jgi:hypothetical protein
MDKDLRDYYDNRLSMFNSQGWRDLRDDIQTMRDSTDTVSGVDDLRKLGVRQGEVSMMDWFLNIERVSREAFDELLEEEKR